MAAASGSLAGRASATSRWLAALLGLVLLASCASFVPPQPYQDAGFESRARSQTQDGLTISAAALGADLSLTCPEDGGTVVRLRHPATVVGPV